MPVISIRAEEIFRIGSYVVTNSLLLACVVALIFFVIAFFLRRNLREVPGKFQAFFELFIEAVLDFMENVIGDRKKSERYLPLVATIFLFVVLSNWMGLLPGITSVGIWEEHHETPSAVTSDAVHEEGAEGEQGSAEPVTQPVEHESEESGTLEEGESRQVLVPLFRAPASDLNFTIALGIIAVLGINIFGVVALGFGRHASKFFTVKNPIASFTGILEFLSEFVRIVSFSFRLFGNVFAGEVLLVIIGFLVPYLVPLPFLFLEVFVGFIQGLIFAMLTLVFIATAVSEDAAH